MKAGLAVWTPLAILAAGHVARAATVEAAAAPPAAPAAASAQPIVAAPTLFSGDDLMLFEVDSGGLQLSDSFGAYSSRAGVFIPLGALARLLDLAITVDPATGRADGWALSEKRQFRLDLAAQEASFGGKAVKLSKETAVLYQDDIYLRQDVIEQLLPLKLKANTSALTLDVTPTEPFPFQQRLEREQRRQGLGAGAASQLPLIVKTPYQLFTPPSVDLNINLGGGNHAPIHTIEYDLRAAGDLAFANFQFYLGTDQNGQPTQDRILFERKDPEGHDAGPFGATRSDLGDTFTPALPIGANSVSGRGFAITSVPLDQTAVFNKVDLRGELQLGWEVELYVNEVLRASQQQPVNGRYEFLQVQLAFGLNTVRLVFYGPRGERREEVQRINVGGSTLAKGQTTYSFGAVQEGRQVAPIGSQTATALTPGDGQWSLTGTVSHGITDTLTASVGFARYTPVLDQTRDMGFVGLNASVLGAAVQADAAVDDRHGAGLSLGVADRIFGTSFVFREAEYQHGFFDQTETLGSATNPEVRDTSLLVDASPKLFGAVLPLSLRVERAQLQNGEAELQFAGNTSRPFGRYLVSSSLVYTKTSGGPAPGNQQLTGELDASGLVSGGWQLRGALQYQLLPSTEVNSLTVTGDRNIGQRLALHLGVEQSFAAPSETAFAAGATVRLSKADISLTGSYTTHTNDFRIGLQVSLGFLFDPLTRRYRAAGPNVADGGAVAMDAFIDRNGDGRPEASDTPLPDIVIQGGRAPVKTDAHGQAIVTGLGDGSIARLQVDTSSIDNPYVTAPPEIIQLVPRPGRVAVVDYALRVTGEVQAHVNFVRPGAAPRGLAALDLELVDAAGKVAAGGRTEFDGTLLLEGVPAGHYALRIAPAQAERLHLELVKPVELTVPVSGGFVGSVAAEVRLAGQPPAPLPRVGD